jgi:hypothetical protein
MLRRAGLLSKNKSFVTPQSRQHLAWLSKHLAQ